MTSSFAERLIADPSDETIDALFEHRQPGIFWVDWRGADDEIIADTAEALGIKELLKPVWDGDRLQIEYKTMRTPVPLEGIPHEQDKTLLALNRALAPDHELRFAKASEGGDTIAFIALPMAEWHALQQQYGSRVEGAFQQLSEDNPLFDE